jgi:hypothetical protein
MAASRFELARPDPIFFQYQDSSSEKGGKIVFFSPDPDNHRPANP